MVLLHVNVAVWPAVMLVGVAVTWIVGAGVGVAVDAGAGLVEGGDVLLAAEPESSPLAAVACGVTVLLAPHPISTASDRSRPIHAGTLRWCSPARDRSEETTGMYGRVAARTYLTIG